MLFFKGVFVVMFDLKYIIMKKIVKFYFVINILNECLFFKILFFFFRNNNEGVELWGFFVLILYIGW